jgi:uncharacterized protein (DUF1800 family)
MNQSKQFASTTRAASGLNPYTGVFGKSELLHLLRRTMFGVKKSTLTTFSGKSMNVVLDAILTNTNDPNNKPLGNYTDTTIPLGQTWVHSPENGGYNNQRRQSYRAWWLKSIVNQKDSITEKLVLFWHNHFATEVSDDSACLGYWYNVNLRKNHLGNFKTFTKEISIDPLMLRYLNGYLNIKSAPDENYARELQELFTLGKGVGSKYTEDDVKAAAKVLTGYQVITNTSTITPAVTQPYSIFNPTRHDVSTKQFSSFYGNKTIAGKTGTAGTTELDELIDMIFLQPEVAKHICRKLYRYFVYYDIDQATEDNIITPLADIFRNNNYEIKPVLKALFSSEHFFDVANKGCVIKTPVDNVVGLVREAGTTFLDDSNITSQYTQYNLLHSYAGVLLQVIGDPPNVAGWQAYYQVPMYHEFWINTFTLPNRRNITSGLILNTFGRGISTDLLAYVKTMDNPEDPNKLIAELLELHISIKIDPNLINSLKTNTLLGGLTNDTYWTQAWNEYLANPTNNTKMKLVLTRIQGLLNSIYNLNEYQLS